MLIDEQDIVLEACVQMGLEAKLDDDRIVMTVDMRVDPIQSLKELAYQRWKGLGERHA